MPTFRTRERQDRFFRDNDGVLAIVKGWDEVNTYAVNWVGRLNTGETISAFSNESSGLTVSGAVTSGTTTTLTVAQTSGEIVYKITTSSGRELEETIRFYAPLSEKSINRYDYGRF